MKFSWAELRRRKVIRVVVAYVVVSWVLIQVGATLFDMLELPAWTDKTLLAVLLLGLPVAIVLAWAYDLTPDGVRLDEGPEVPGDAAAALPGSAAAGQLARQKFTFADLGAIDLDQLDLGRPQLTPLYGRSEETAILEKRLAAAARGQGGIVFIGGRPGEGKTRLGEEAMELGLRRGMLPLIGQAYEENTAPFITSTEIIEDVQRALPTEALRNALGDVAPEIARLVPALRRTLPDIPPPDDLPAEQQQRYFFNAMLEFTARLAEACPLVILLDDMQWADESSAGLLEHVAPHLPRLPILMVATYRDVATDLREPFKHALARLSHQDYATRIRLKPLGSSAVSEMLTSLSGQPAPDAMAELIFEETGGNAFFAKSLYQHLAEEGVLFDEQGRWRTEIDRDALSVPEGVRLVIERRLARLDEQTQAVLSAGAVEGLRFDQRVLEIALGEALAGADAVSAEAVLEAVEQADTAGLIFAIGGQRETRFEFAHALVRQALLDALSSGRMQRQHWRLGQALEQLYGEDRERASDIAHHYYRAGSQADAQRTVRFLVLAGERALDTAAADEAAVAFTRALEYETDNLARANLLYQRGMAYRTSGNIDRGFDDWLAALPAFEAQPDPERVAEICWAMAYGLSWKNEMQAGEALARRGLAVVGEAPGIARCRLLGVLGMCVGNRDSFELWEQHSREAVEMARDLDDDRLRTEVLMGRQYLGEHYFEGALAVAAGEEAVPCARRLNEPWELCSTLGVMMVGCFKTLNLDVIDATWEECVQLARKYGDYGNEMHAMVIRGSIQAMRGHLDEGFALVDDRARWSREVNFAWKSIMIEMSANVEFLRGNWDQARSMYAEIMAEPVVGTMSGIEAAAQALFFAYADDPAIDEAIEAIKPRAAIAGQKNQIGAWFTVIALLEIYAVRGDREACAALYDAPVQLESQGSRSVWLKGLSTTFAGIAAAAGGHWDLAEKHFDTSEATAKSLGLALPAAELLRWRAQALLWRDAGSDRVHARELLAQAAAAYRQLGMRRHVQLVESLAVQAMGDAIGRSPVNG